jgi:hypothetical protein
VSIPIIAWDGQPISKPGIYSGIPMDAYHGQLTVGPSVSSSGLRTLFSQSPRAYFRDSYLNPARREQKVTEAFVFGRGAHHLLLGEANFRKHFIVRPEKYPEGTSYKWIEPRVLGDPPFFKAWSSNSNWCRAWALNAWMVGLTVLTQGDIKMIRAMADALSEDPLVQAGILNGLIELSFVWQDKETGVWLKWRPDALPTDDLSFADLKTTADISDEALERSVGTYAYHMQGALGAMACREILGRDMTDFSLVFVEKQDTLPCVRTKTIQPGFIAMGVEQIEVSLKLFKRCLDTGKWPGPGGEQHDAEYIGLFGKVAEKQAYRIDEIKRQLA